MPAELELSKHRDIASIHMDCVGNQSSAVEMCNDAMHAFNQLCVDDITFPDTSKATGFCAVTV